MMRNKATATPKPTGVLHFSKAVRVKTYMGAWADESTFTVPFSGEVNPENAYAISNAIHRKFARPGSIVGSSYGSCSVRTENVDTVNKIVTYTLSYGIGE